jgi:hypothetical protein
MKKQVFLLSILVGKNKPYEKDPRIAIYIQTNTI